MTHQPLQGHAVPRRLWVAALALSTACATTTADLPQPDRRLASIGNLGTRSNFEIRTLYAVQDPAPPPADDRSSKRRRPVTPILFYLGISMAVAAGVGTIATSFASYGLRRKLDDGYFEDGFGYDDYDRTVETGNRLSKASWGLGMTAVAFAAMALISYSVDWARCGPLAPKRRRDTAPRGRCEEYHPDHKSPDAPVVVPASEPTPAGPGLAPGPTASSGDPAPATPPAEGPAPAPGN
ncbi:hypothetical protein [Nannocystis punicea]|uniref:Uncharacterized protein n=1 Tax=Nannocystis punicea TaxID=2995304 RepID=A0ABY7H228_9BACT|nr:hypothetical protein [Nannocystis poenicansa]WAS93228.1 hypothetical protein O0S08_44270 [Nannocystis poenicansa]